MKSFGFAVVAAALAFAGVMLVRQFTASASSHKFDTVKASYSTSLADAFERSEATGKPLYVLVTADWCGPCQILKGNTLADPGVAERLDDEFIPVYLEESAAALDLQSLPTQVRRVLPTSLVIADKQIVAVLEGYAGPEDFEKLLDRGLANASEASEPETESVEATASNG
ncbi:MAG: thioredoxin family protein [Planctomycetota bacterium]